MAFLIASSSRAEEFAAFARDLDPALDVRVAPNLGKAEEIEYALAWQPPNGLLKTLPNLRLIVSVGAGVDALLADPDLPHVPMVRFVDADLTGRMTEYVALHVLYHHRRMSEFGELQRRRVWKYLAEPAAHEVRVGAPRPDGATQGTRPARAPDDARRDQRAEADHEEDDLAAGDPRLELRRREIDEPEVEPRQQRADEIAEELRPRQLRECALDVGHPPKV